MVDYASANHALLSDPRLEHLLLRYPQNRGSGSLLPMAPRQNTPNIARTADFCMAKSFPRAKEWMALWADGDPLRIHRAAPKKNDSSQ